MDTVDPEAQDRAEMARLANGHREALDALMERHGPSIIRFLRQMLGNEEDAQDLAQESFVRVYRSCGSYRPEHKFSTWLLTIAANLARNQLRWRSRHPNVTMDGDAGPAEQPLSAVLPSEALTPREAMLETERHEAVREAVRGLPSELREAILLCEWEECSVADASVVLGTSAKAVESRLYRARQRLKQRLAERDSGG
jgi:RNA polymerase sigma-70 factor (ECF subfamily)